RHGYVEAEALYSLALAHCREGGMNVHSALGAGPPAPSATANGMNVHSVVEETGASVGPDSLRGMNVHSATGKTQRPDTLRGMNVHSGAGPGAGAGGAGPPLPSSTADRMNVHSARLHAHRGRGLMRYRVGRYDDSLSDLARARELAG